MRLYNLLFVSIFIYGHFEYIVRDPPDELIVSSYCLRTFAAPGYFI